VLTLSLDTSIRTGSAAVLTGTTVLHEIEGDSTVTHTERLPVDLMRLLDKVGLRIEDVELFAVAVGPGSFTGLRTGIATIQGLAVARGRRVVPVSTFDALARSTTIGTGRIGAWMDAQRGEVFASLYSPDGRDVILAPSHAPPAATLAAWREVVDLSDTVFIGDGALRYRDIITAHLSDACIEAPPLLAGVIGRIAAEEASRAVLPHAVVPLYVRRPDAELARDRRGAGN
jgi:tRNA threonylcarbamoyladenosine biosynthesis protein TsaB